MDKKALRLLLLIMRKLWLKYRIVHQLEFLNEGNGAGAPRGLQTRWPVCNPDESPVQFRLPLSIMKLLFAAFVIKKT